MTTTEQNISSRKKFFFYIVMLLLMALTLEVFSLIILKIKINDYSSEYSVSLRDSIINNYDTDIINKPSLLVSHPYLGYVYDPNTNNKNLITQHGGLSISPYGFIDNGTPFYEDKDDTFIIGIFGGSVAFYLSAFGVDAVIDQLKDLSIVKNKKIEIVRLALGGYKQPQQLLSLTYLLSLGAHFDMVINFDGFNEIALPPVENIPKNVSPSFPRTWAWQTEKLMDHETKSIIGIITNLRQKKTAYASLFNIKILKHSYAMNLTWHLIEKFFTLRIIEQQTALKLSLNKVEDFEKTGPGYSYTNAKEMYNDLANYWKESSIQMARVCEANNILYWHFLQPNQYFTGSKSLSEEEKELAFNVDSPYRNHIEQGYPLLREAGAELSSSGIQFHDLTMIFKDHAETLYSDDCCHLNNNGNIILGETVGKLIAQDFFKEN